MAASMPLRTGASSFPSVQFSLSPTSPRRDLGPKRAKSQCTPLLARKQRVLRFATISSPSGASRNQRVLNNKRFYLALVTATTSVKIP